MMDVIWVLKETEPISRYLVACVTIKWRKWNINKFEHMFFHASNKQFIESSSKLEYCLDCVIVYHKYMKNISENNM